MVFRKGKNRGKTGNNPLLRVLPDETGSQRFPRSLLSLDILAEAGATSLRIMSKKDMSNRSTEYAVSDSLLCG